MMEFTSIPIIVVICYIIGEIYKVVFRKKKEAKKIIPMVMAIMGGILGILIYQTNPEIIFNVDNIWVAIVVGIASGESATGTNQIIKQILNKRE